MGKSSSLTIGSKICEALGLDADDVTRLTIEVKGSGQPAIVRTESVVCDDGSGIATVLREYELKPKGAASDG